MSEKLYTKKEVEDMIGEEKKHSKHHTSAWCPECEIEGYNQAKKEIRDKVHKTDHIEKQIGGALRKL